MYERYKYMGATPGNDTNDYTLFDSTALMLATKNTDGGLAMAKIARVTLVLYTTQNGTLKTNWKAIGETAWLTYESDVAVSKMSAGQQALAKDYSVDDIDDFQIIWTHGGIEIGSSGSFIVTVHGHHERSVAT